MSRGLTQKEANKLIIRAKFNKTIETIPNEDLKCQIIKEIGQRLDQHWGLSLNGCRKTRLGNKNKIQNKEIMKNKNNVEKTTNVPNREPSKERIKSREKQEVKNKKHPLG